MKLHELIDELSTLVRENPNSDIMVRDVLVEELVGGFQENIEGIKQTTDFFSDTPVIAITFRNQ